MYKMFQKDLHIGVSLVVTCQSFILTAANCTTKLTVAILVTDTRFVNSLSANADVSDDLVH